MRKRFLSLLVAMPFLFTTHAEDLTIERCVELAREHYPAISQYGLIEKMAHYDLSNASKAWLPQGSISGQVSWQNNVVAWPDQFAAMLAQQGIDFPGLDKTQYKVGVDVNQQIWDGGRVSANRRAIEAAADVERRNLDVQIYDVEGKVQDIYLSILLLDGRMRSIEKSMVLVDSTLTQVKSMFRNGVAMQSDCDQIEARMLTLSQQKTQLAATRESFRRMLEIFIGQQIGDRELVLPSEQPASAADHPQLQFFGAQLDNIKTRENAVNASVMPQIGAFASGYYGYPGYNMFKNMQTHDPSFNFMIGVRVGWNFGSLYTKRNSLDKLQMQRRQIETNREIFLFNNDIAQTEEAAQIESLRKVMKEDERIVELHRSVIRASQSQLRNGVIEPTTLLSKITDAELAENNLLIHRIELIKAIYNLNHIKNK